MSQQAEYICGCRSCGNHCMVVERVRSVDVTGEVAYTDGYLGGWRGVQTEVVTCPHCGIVISWRKNCLSAELLRRSGDLGRFYLPMAAWGPPSLYWAGFEQYDAEFHPPVKGKKPGSSTLPRLARPPKPADLWSLRKRGWLARGLLWLDNDRDRAEFTFGAQRPGKRTADDEHRRARLLRALLESALFGGDESDENALDMAEWHRQLQEWDAAMQALDRTFDGLVLADRAQQLEELVGARNSAVVAFRAPPVVQEQPPAPAAPEPMLEWTPEPEPMAEPVPAPDPEPVAEPAAVVVAERQPEPASAPPSPPAASKKPAESIDTRTPRDLLDLLLEVLGSMPAETLTRDHIPRPYGALLRTLRKSNRWDEDSFAVAVISGFARAHGWPQDADAASVQLLRELVVVDEALLDYLAAGFKRASWDQWAFDVPSSPAPKGA